MDVITKTKKLKIVGLCVFFLFACERQEKETTKLTIQFPTTSLSTLSAFQSISTLNTSQFSSTVPTGFSGASPFNCFGFYASGPEADLKKNRCKKVDTGEQSVSFGPMVRGFASGSTGEFEVPSGGDRVIGVFGVYAENAAACASMRQNDFDKSKMSKPYILGEVGRLNLTPGDTVTIQVPLSFNTTRYFDKCEGVDFGDGTGGIVGGNPPASLSDFGTGADGDYTLSAGTVASNSALTTSGKMMNPGLRVTSITDDKNWNFTPTIGSSFAVNDEVLLTVVAAYGSNPDTVCGGGMQRGSYRFAKIKSKGSSTLEFYDAPYDFGGVSPNSTAIANPNYNSGDFCDIRLVRVAHMNNVSLTASGSLQAVATDATNNTGIIAMRVKGTLTVGGSSSLWAQGRGFQSNAGNTVSSGVTGKFNGGSAGAMGAMGTFFDGGSGGSNYGFGGGGNQGNGGSGVLRTNTAANLFCSGSPCGPLDKMFMGGAGGGDGLTTPGIGGSGGGLIFIVAYQITVAGSFGSIDASGLPTYAGSNGTGGGAGGTAFVRANIVNTTSGPLKVYANGAKPQDLSGGSSYSPGGGGGGGVAALHYCVVTGGNAPIVEANKGLKASNTISLAVASDGANGLVNEATKSELCHMP